MQDDLEELGLELGRRVAIANYLQAAKNRFKGNQQTSNPLMHDPYLSPQWARLRAFKPRSTARIWYFRVSSVRATLAMCGRYIWTRNFALKRTNSHHTTAQGKLRGTTTVAIKTIRSEDKTAFLLEAHIMACVRCCLFPCPASP